MPLWGRVGPQHGVGVLARLRQRTCVLMNAIARPRAPQGGHPEKDKIVGLTGAERISLQCRSEVFRCRRALLAL